MVSATWARAADTLSGVLGGAQLLSGDGGWALAHHFGAVDADWALALLRAGEAPFLGADADGTFGAEMELVAERDTLYVVVSDERSAIVLNLKRGSNVGAALGFAHEEVRKREV